MTNIKNLQIWNDICADARVCVSKSFMGLKTTVKYVPTGSVVDVKNYELSVQDGGCLLHILHSSRDKLLNEMETFRLKEVPNGNYKLEACVSQDGEFVALLLLHFKDYSYERVTDVLVYEGEDAKIISKMF